MKQMLLDYYYLVPGFERNVSGLTSGTRTTTNRPRDTKKRPPGNASGYPLSLLMLIFLLQFNGQKISKESWKEEKGTRVGKKYLELLLLKK